MVSHGVVIRSPRSLWSHAGPLLLERSDARFMEGVQRELGEVSRRDALLSTRARRKGTDLQLFQPVHRVSTLAVCEVVCNVPGEPRLGREKIDSAGIVVRRLDPRGEEQAWMRQGEAIRGWVNLVPERSATPGVVRVSDDPDAARRRGLDRHPSLVPHLARLSLAPSVLSEQVTDLFVLPPATCEAARATLLYGLVPTASMESSQSVTPGSFTRDDVLADLPAYLKASSTLERELVAAPSVPQAGRRLERPRGPIREAALKAYADFVERVVGEYDLLGDSAPVRRLRAALDTIRVELDERDSVTLTQHLTDAAKVLVMAPPLPTAQQPNPADASVRMPRRWPEISAAQEERIAGAVADILVQQAGKFLSREGRFDDAGARYVARAFVRVQDEPGCPPHIYWTERSEPFTIAPWYQSGPAPIPVVPLPDPLKGLGDFKPNVAFALPASVSDIVHKNSPEALLEGRGERGLGLGLGWLCGFNIPLITLCAFIVLSIFLSLFNILFWWLAFIRICIPIPRKQ